MAILRLDGVPMAHRPQWIQLSFEESVTLTGLMFSGKLPPMSTVITWNHPKMERGELFDASSQGKAGSTQTD